MKCSVMGSTGTVSSMWVNRRKAISLPCNASDDRVEAVIAKGYARVMAVLSQRMKRPLNSREARELIDAWPG